MAKSIIKRKMSVRASRATESHSYEGRVTEERPPIVFSENSRFNVPQAIKDADPLHSYSYIAYMSGGTEKRDEYYDAIHRRYFKPVRASENPILARRYELDPFDKKDEDDLIKVGGQILMKRPIEAKEAEDKYYDEKNSRNAYISEMHNSRDLSRPRMIRDERSWQQK